VELFQNIIHDLFPAVAVPDQDHGVLEHAVLHVLQQRGLQGPPRYVTKVGEARAHCLDAERMVRSRGWLFLDCNGREWEWS